MSAQPEVPPVNPVAAALGTLVECAERRGLPRTFFYTRFQRFKEHTDPERRPPLPVARYGGQDVYEVQAVYLWDERRVQHDAQQRETWEKARMERAAKKETKS